VVVGGGQNYSSSKGEEKKITSYMDNVDDVKKGRDHAYIVEMISEYFS
jgi:hypothetical protein